MTTTENETSTPARRVRVTYEPVPGVKPWRAAIYAAEAPDARSWGLEVPVGRFDSLHEAATTGVSACRFVEAGVRWVPVGEPVVEAEATS